MLWHKRGGAAFYDGPGAPIDLRTMVGLPGRLLFADGATDHRMTNLVCTVQQVNHTQLIVHVASPQASPQPGSAVILEVAQQAAMVQCFTLVQAVGPGSQITLRTPGRPHVLQRRRFPRIDLFLGITVATPDYPIDYLPAQMINLSMDGAACVMAEPVSPGVLLNLNLTSIGFHPPETQVLVIRCTPSPSHLWVVGVKFLSLQPEQELYLGKYISDVTEMPSV